MSQSILLSEPKQLINSIVFCLNSMISESSVQLCQPSIFDLKNKPTISFPNYLMRIFSFMGCSITAYIYSLILIDKIQQENIGFKITSKNIHRLLFTSIVVATKFIDDKYYNNNFYAKVGGVSLQTLNQQQQNFMNLLNYHCPSNAQLFQSYLERLQKFTISLMQDQNNKLEANKPTAPAQQPTEQVKQKKRQVRQKRQRSRDKYIDRNYQTQQSRQIQPL